MASPSGPNPLFLREEELRQAMEMLFIAQRNVAAQADPLLERRGLGRAHHRVVYFVAREPDITVAALLDRLKVTKQSLARVVSDLTAGGYLEQGRGLRDRRQRTLRLTDAGRALERELGQRQRELIARAYREAGAEAVAGFRRVMLELMNESDRTRFVADEPGPDERAPSR